MVSIGIDPDVHTCAIACLIDHAEGIEIAVGIIRNNQGKGREASLQMTEKIKKEFEKYTVAEAHVLTVEGQDVRYTGKTSRANPQDICNLALITGAAYACIPSNVKYSPLPREWKGTVPKHIKQCRILDDLGIRYTMAGGTHPYPVPTNFERYCVGQVNASDWQDLTDALGLAAWGLAKYKATLRLKKERTTCGIED
jgi:hypothetical protein